MKQRRSRLLMGLAATAVLAALFSCKGGGGAGTGNESAVGAQPEHLTVGDVNTVVLQAIHEASARGAPATIAVVDRVGNVLAVAQMPGAPATVTINGGRSVTTGLDGISGVPSTLAAIAKAITGAYLSSNGNAFSTRTANQIVQQHFNPGVAGTPSGPLFGVQLSQLPCSDFNTVAAATPGATNAGPHRSPLGFAADSGGLPIYKNGMLQGGIGVMSTATYSLNPNVFNVPIDNDEVIAIAGVTGYEAPAGIMASTIAVGGSPCNIPMQLRPILRVPSLVRGVSRRCR